MIDRPLLPPRLQRGDTIGLLCPAGPVREMQHLQVGIRLITDMGFMKTVNLKKSFLKTILFGKAFLGLDWLAEDLLWIATHSKRKKIHIRN